MKKLLLNSVTFVIILITSLTSVSAAQKGRGFTIFDGKTVAQIYLSANEEKPLKIAAEHLQNDIEMVTGMRPQIINDKSKITSNVIILSTADNNNLIDDSSLDGLYESYVIEPVKSPFGSDHKSLVVVGSDNLGAVYGTYNISELIGVSPLYWWCDVTPKKCNEVVIDDCKVAPHQPTVRYRGIFINDEEAMIKWSEFTSLDKSKGALSPETYERVFELMLRLKANTLWPSMMEAGSFFFEAKDENGIAINPRNATDYGIYIGTSHCENMARNNYDEWYDWAEDHKELFAPGETNFEFDYTVNPEAIEVYWMERLHESKDFNMIYTMGIRGVHDTPFHCRLLENPTLENRVKLLQGVLNRQREMIAEVFGSEDAVPQIFVPYEETAELYNGESKNGDEKCKGLDVPEDIMIVSTEDNYGYLRQLPTAKELQRKGGCGIYYHLAYQGFPSPYDWLTTMPYELMRQELQKLHNVGSTKFWIVNIGDIKPTEMGLNLFMEIANDADKYLAMNPREYVASMASDIFAMDANTANSFSDLYTRFCLLANMQKPEFMTSFWSVDFEIRNVYGVNDIFSFYSTVDFGDEAQRIIERYKSIEAEAKEMYDNLPESSKAPFWHLAYYPIRASRQMAEKSYYFHKNKIYANQGRLRSVNAYKRLSEKAASEIKGDLNYYNNELCGGKWNGIMDPYGDFNITERVLDIANIPEELAFQERFSEQAIEEVGAVCEGQLKGDEEIELLFSSLEDNTRFIDIFNKGIKEHKWEVNSNCDWIKFSQENGNVDSEERLWVSIDWNKANSGENRGEITIKGEKGEVKNFPVVATKFTERIKPNSYVEGSGFVAIEAENYSKQTKGKDGAKWEAINDLGYSGTSMVVRGKEKAKNIKSGAILEYQVYFNSTGEFYGELYRIPTLNEGKGKSCEIAIGIDDSTPWVLDGVRRKSQRLSETLSDGTTEVRNWHAGVIAQMEKMPFKITVDKVGYHTFKVYQVDNGIAFDRVVIATNEQSATAQKRSHFGALESYNNIDKKYVQPTQRTNVDIDEETAKTEGYPNLKPLIYAKFMFSKQGNPAVWGFTPVSPHNVFDPNYTLFGWDKEDAPNVVYTHYEGSRLVPHFRRDTNTSKYPATFYVSLLEGDYELAIHTGKMSSPRGSANSPEQTMTVHANGKEILKNESIEDYKSSIEHFNVEVGDDNLLKIDFSGKWAISVIEIYRK